MRLILLAAVLVCVVQCLPMSKDELEDFRNFLLKTSSLDIHVKSADPDDAFDEDEVISDNAWEESGKFEGDLILNDRQRRLIVENVEGLSRNGLTDTTKRWPNNEVIYFIQREHFTSGQVQAIQDGIDDLARASCVKFRPYRKGDRDAVVIQGSRRGCFSQVGYQGGYQVLNLSGRHPVGRGCFRHGTVVHELLHSLGFYHMQSSPDRDDYIDVVWANIIQPARHNFRKYNSFSVSDFGVGYDYDSVLHYSRRAFSANGQDTLVPKKSGVEIGQRIGLSDKDTQKLNKMYCDADNNDPGLQADENPSKKQKNKKKKPKNQPFEGHGIGYHQGKTVVIKLPAAETFKLHNVPSFPVFDFSKAPQILSPEADRNRFGEEITYTYQPTYSEKTSFNEHYKPEEVNNKDIESYDSLQNKTEPLIDVTNDKSSETLEDSDSFKPRYVPIDDHDKDLQEAFRRLNKIVKQHVYPKNKNYDYKINKDYSKFYRPIEHQKSDDRNHVSWITDEKKPQKQTDLKRIESKENNNQDEMNDSYRTSLPTKKPFTSYEQTETPHYATLEYLKNRHDFSDIYSPNSSYETTNENLNKDIKDVKYNSDIKINPHDRGFYTDYVKTRNKSPSQESISKDIEAPETYKNKNVKYAIDKEDSSYGTLILTTKPFSAYEDTETPNYATLEYLKDRHDISDVYLPKKQIISTNMREKEPYTIDNPLTDSNWYTKDSFKHNPADYDRDSFSENVKYNENKNEGGHIESTEIQNNDGNNVKSVAPYSKKAQDYYADQSDERESYENTAKDVSSERDRPKKKNIYNHYQEENSGENSEEYSTEAGYYDDKNIHSDESHETHINKPYNGHTYNTYNYHPEYKGKLNSKIERRTSEESDESSKESSRKNQPYKLFGVPVPVSKDWYKISYSAPEVPKSYEYAP